MPSASPSPIKRPSLSERAGSAHSLSSSNRQTSHKVVYRPHTVTRHSRNTSHGKGLSKLGRVQSTANITSDNQKNHQRKKSGGTTPPHSPRTPLVKRNSSHVALPKNTSFGNLRKNHSATALPRNVSHGAFKKIGLAPVVKQKEANDGIFQLGDRSSDDEEEGEWEDSATQSPELTRYNSKTSTPARSHNPIEDQGPQQHPAQDIARKQKTSSPPLPSLKNNNENRSAPNLQNEQLVSQTQNPPDPALLQQYTRSSRAPPAMSTVSAHVGPNQMLRSDSSKSFTHISHADATSTHGTTANATSTSSGPASGPIPASSSIEAGVSHFLAADTPAGSVRQTAPESDEDSPTNFLSNYRPQPSESLEKTRTLHKARVSQMQSRTQQKLDLQKREIARAGAVTPTAPIAGMGAPLASAASLHGRAASRNRNRSLAGEAKAVKQDYESAVKQFLVVRRFRSPMIESLSRLKDKSTLPQDIGSAISGGTAAKSRPQSRRGPSTTTVNGHARPGVSQSFEEQRSSPLASRSNSRGRGGGRVHFQRQSSPNDIDVTPSRSETGLDGAQDDEQDGLSPEEALIRRIWASREVYEPGDHAQA